MIAGYLQVASCYPKEVQGFSAELTSLLEDQGDSIPTPDQGFWPEAC